jgi:hypothetical protein
MKAISLILSSLLLAACSGNYSPRFYYSYIQVANLTGKTISNLELQVGERELACDTLTNNSICDDQFGKRPYPQQPVQLSWQDGDGKQQTRQPNPPVLATMTPGKPLRLHLEIHEDGSVKSTLQQNGQMF